MTNNLLMDFSVDKKNNKIHVKREFAAPLEGVWAAWTQAELLDKWWAPRPYRTQTKTMDFREGGHWLYAMISPENEAHWCRADYQKISPAKSYQYLDAFCNEAGEITTAFPRTQWQVNFKGAAGSTFVEVELTYQQLSDLEKILELGFKEGFTMAMGNLDELLSQA